MRVGNRDGGREILSADWKTSRRADRNKVGRPEFQHGLHRRQDYTMPRAYWKGYLRLSLVTCPIELFPATSQAEKTHFHQINTQTGHRLRQQMVDEETGGR